MVAVCGESGSGKSVLVQAATTAGPALRQLRGNCDPLRTPRPLGPFRDVARVAGLSQVIRTDEAAFLDVCEDVYEGLRSTPTVLVIEDLHWVDAASVDVLRFLVRRLDVMPLAIVVTYRDDEVTTGHPARALLGDLARSAEADTLRLAPLSEAAVARLVSSTRLDPHRVHALTGGNPYFVREVADEPDLPLPSSIRDAILARTADLAPADLEVLQLVAAAPDRLDDRLLPALDVDLPTLRRIDATGLIVRSRGGLAFRHELARQALESTVPPGGAPSLHARVLGALERVEPAEPAVLTHHAVEARDAERAARYAQLAAAEAIRSGAHSEAAAFLTVALENLPDAGPAEHADLLARLSFQQYMTGRLSLAISTIRTSYPLWQRASDPAGLARAHESCAIYEYYAARRREAERQAGEAARIASDAGADGALGETSATRGYLAYMRNDFDQAEAFLTEAGRIADQEGRGPLRLRASLFLTVARLADGDGLAREQLAAHVDTARSQEWDELASTGYSHLATLDVEQRRYRSAEHVLEHSIPFATERDIPICRQWQTAVRSRAHLAQGLWNAAQEDADEVLDGAGMILSHLWPHLVTGLIALRRRGPEAATDAIEAAWELTQQLDEPLRRLPVYSALAELMWMTDRPDSRVTQDAVAELFEATDTRGLDWARGDLAVWLRRLDLLAQVPEAVAEPFALSLHGQASAAAAWWSRAGEPYTEAMALWDAPDPDTRGRAVELLDQLGAAATADRLRVELRRDGVLRVPVRPRESTRGNPSGLTNRQLDVAKLLARGFTNAEIATRLYISPKTTDHHVSAVLAKLGLPTRRAVAVRAGELGLG